MVTGRIPGSILLPLAISKKDFTLHVSDHALVRYMERIKKFNLEKYKKRVKSDTELLSLLKKKRFNIELYKLELLCISKGKTSNFKFNEYEIRIHQNNIITCVKLKD